MMLVGGLALFMLGINFLSKGMEKFAGAAMQRLIEHLTSNRIKGFGVGAFASATLQSSSMVMVTMIGMMNAGLMGLEQGIGVILGFEVGTTVTAQLIAFDIGVLYLAAIALGFFMHFISKKLKRRYLGQAILGFGILFMGMALMKDAMLPLGNSPNVIATMVIFAKWPVLAVLAGLILTAIIQSSSATIGMAIAMGAAGTISLEAAIAIALGANVGTCITGLLASIGGSRGARQAVMAQIGIATLGMLIFLPIISPFAGLIELTASSLPRQIANAHTVHNIFMSLMLMPFTFLIARLVRKFVPDDKKRRKAKLKKYDPIEDPAGALSDLRKEVVRLGMWAKHMLEHAEFALMNQEKSLVIKALREVESTEEDVDQLRYDIEKHLTAISGPKFTEQNSNERVALLHNSVDIERVADLSLNLVEYAKELVDSREKLEEHDLLALKRMFKEVRHAVAVAMEAIEKKSLPLCREVRTIEENIDDIYDIEHRAHLKRLDMLESGGRESAVFLEAMRDLERIGDHTDNIAKSMLNYTDSDIKISD